MTDKVYYNDERGTTNAVGSFDMWWKGDKAKVADNVFAMVDMLKQTDSDRFKRNVQQLRLYGNQNVDGFFPQQYTNILAPALPEARIKYNIISSMTDTVTSKIGKMKPRITFLTSGGTWDDQMRSKKLTKFIDGAFYKNKVYPMHRDMFRDGCVFDAGILKHYIDNGSIKSERVVSTEICVDQMDAMYGDPSHLYHVKWMRIDELVEQFGGGENDIEQRIKSSGETAEGAMQFNNKLSDHVQVVEAWKRPTGPDAGDGRHVICVENATLIDEEYDKDYFPFTFFHWARPVVGFWGQSLADRLTGNQLEINKMLRIIQRSFHLGSAFKVFLEYGSKVAREHINNEIGSIVYYSGSRPEFYVPQTVHSEFFSFLEWLIRSSYEEAGISQLSASAKKPAELESGRALREYHLIETERFASTAQSYEESFMHTARVYLDLAKELYEDGVDIEIHTGSKKFLESVKWSEIDVSGDDYIMKMYPTSMLPTEPAGRIATIQEWVNSGVIPPEEGMRLMDFPDVEEYRSLQDSPIDDMYYVLENLLYKGRFLSPEPFEDLAYGLEFMQKAYLRARVDEAPEDRLELMRRWISQAERLENKRKQAAAEMQAQAQMTAGAAPQQAPMAEAQGAPQMAAEVAPGIPNVG